MAKKIELHQLLVKCIEKYDLDLMDIVDNLENADFFVIEKLQDIVNDEFINNGLDVNQNPTKYGLQLEDLIDYLGEYYLDEQ